MGRNLKGLAILGSTGSVGTQTLDVVRLFPNIFDVVGLAAHRNLARLGAQIAEFEPKYFACEGVPQQLERLGRFGSQPLSMLDMAIHPDVDLLVTATVGDVALVPTIAAIEAGKDVAIANKESVIIAGKALTELANLHQVNLLPMDSEPNAIWQCIRGESENISKLVITASGGSFRDYDLNQLHGVSPEEALNHPTWEMGAKITVDSATLMNKAFEVIEAHWLFGVAWEDIEVVIHPQSYVHSMVEFVDGSVKAQISPPDMHLPIQYSLLYPERIRNPEISRFDPVKVGELTFRELEAERYPCFELALRVAKRGGTWPAALCGADEVAVEMFLGGEIKFTDIAVVIEQALQTHDAIEDPTPTQSLEAASWAKSEVRKMLT